MSGAQPKAAVIAKGVCIVAEINTKATKKRHEQGWVDLVYKDLDKLIDRALVAKNNKEAISIAYDGHIVDLWERLVERKVKHPLYGKYINQSNKFHAHDEKNEIAEGDVVQITEHKPISKSKSWVVTKVVSKGQG